MIIEELNHYSEEEFEQLSELMNVLDPTLPLRHEVVDALILSTDSHLFVMRDRERIIGSYTLGVFVSPTGKKASLEDVVIHPDFQGQHLGKELLEHALKELQQMAPIHLQLTSRPSREAANRLYKKIGLLRKETNVYTLNFV